MFQNLATLKFGKVITSPNFKTVNILIIQGYHIYQSIWTPTIGETLICKQEGGNAHDRYIVGCYKPDSTLVGHVPKKISILCNLFLRDATNRITCVISGSRRYSSDLIQGGMKIPCT